MQKQAVARAQMTPVMPGRRALLLQRSCAPCAAGGGACADCDDQSSRLLQRHPAGALQHSVAPPIVHDVLRSSGSRLDDATRAVMESRFAHDFSGVRVHADARADASARSVNAVAYTVGRDVVFAAGRYAPRTPAGTALLAHELAHVAQQANRSADPGAEIEVGASDSAHEHEAAAAARAVAASGRAGAFLGDRAVLRRQQGPPAVRDPAKTARSVNHAGHALTASDVAAIRTHLATTKLPAVQTPAKALSSATFLLHDTSAPVSKSTIANEAKLGRGPLGKGVSAWVPRDGGATVARTFYESKRPTTTDFEKGTDTLKQPAREAAFRSVWGATSKSERTAALVAALAGQGLTPKESAEEQKAARAQLDATSAAVKIFTTAAWAVQAICTQIAAKGVKAVAATPGDEAKLTAGCKTLAPYLAARDQRVSSTVGVEIVQQGVIKDEKGAGKMDTCNPKNPNMAPLNKPPYSDSQYANVIALYLRAALAAGVFPSTTTHFVQDAAFPGGHCDPRCFDLDRLYRGIAKALGHPKGSSYGITPKYGPVPKKHTVWWDDKVCYGAHP